MHEMLATGHKPQNEALGQFGDYRFSHRSRGGHEQEVSVPFGGSPLDQGPDLGTPEAQVDYRVQALLAVEHNAVHMLSIQHQLSCHKIDLHEYQSRAPEDSCEAYQLEFDNVCSRRGR